MGEPPEGRPPGAKHDSLDLGGSVGALGKLPLAFSPGETWNYSVSTDVLGAVVQRVSGLPLDQFFSENIFKPLQMHDTGFVVPADKADLYSALI